MDEAFAWRGPAAGAALEEKPTAKPVFTPGPELSIGALYKLFAALFLVSTVFKVWLALNSNVLWEEAHFAVAGRHPDWGYADIPAGFPLLTGLFTAIFGWSPAALRLVGLVFAQAIPFAVAFLAEPLVGRRQAVWAAILAVVFLPTASNGVVYYPETMLQLLFLGMLGFFVRAMASGSFLHWALTGVCGALGLFVHYRFGLCGLGVLAFLMATSEGRAQWRRPGLYLAGAIALVFGVGPWIVYNVREHFASVQYHAVDRLGWGFYPKGLTGHLGEQLGAAGPIFFVAAIAAAWSGWKSEKAGAKAAVIAAATIFLFYTALSPFYHTRYAHWPFMAYAAVLPFAPGVLARFADRAASSGERMARLSVIGFGAAWTAVAAAFFGAFFFFWHQPAALAPAMRANLRFSLEDWRRLDKPIADLQARYRLDTSAIAVSGHWNAVRLAFPGVVGRAVYDLATVQDRVTGFDRQQARWGRGEAALARDLAGKRMLVLLQEPTYLYHDPEEIAFRERMCRTFDGLTRASLITLPPGKVAVEAWVGAPRAAPAEAASADCPLFPALYVAQPERGGALKKKAENAFGIAAFKEGVASIEVLADGAPLAKADPRIDEPGFRAPQRLAFDPDYPKVQWAAPISGANLSKGPHALTVRATLKDGRIVESAPRVIYGAR